MLLLFGFVLSLNDLPGTVTVTENVLFSFESSVVMFVFRTDSPPVCCLTAALLAGIEIISWIAVLTEHSIPQPQPRDGELRTCRKRDCTERVRVGTQCTECPLAQSVREKECRVCPSSVILSYDLSW